MSLRNGLSGWQNAIGRLESDYPDPVWTTRMALPVGTGKSIERERPTCSLMGWGRGWHPSHVAANRGLPLQIRSLIDGSQEWRYLHSKRYPATWSIESYADSQSASIVLQCLNKKYPVTVFSVNKRLKKHRQITININMHVYCSICHLANASL